MLVKQLHFFRIHAFGCKQGDPRDGFIVRVADLADRRYLGQRRGSFLTRGSQRNDPLIRYKWKRSSEIHETEFDSSARNILQCGGSTLIGNITQLDAGCAAKEFG